MRQRESRGGEIPVYEPRAALLLAETRQDLHLLQMRVSLPWLFDTPKGSDRWVDGCPGSCGPRLRYLSPVPVHPPKPPVLVLSLRKVLPPGLKGSAHHDSTSAFFSAGDCSVPPRLHKRFGFAAKDPARENAQSR